MSEFRELREKHALYVRQADFIRAHGVAARMLDILMNRLSRLLLAAKQVDEDCDLPPSEYSSLERRSLTLLRDVASEVESEIRP